MRGWKPENYEHEYMGPVTLTQALANSLNTVSVRLTLEFGPAAVIRTAYRLGINSLLEPNASIALGTSEVSPIELVSAYAPFANGGFAISPHVIARVRSTDGKLLYARPTQALGRIVDARYVAMMNGMLHETLVSGTARHADLPGWPAAGKTGTSQDYRDAWFIGYTGTSSPASGSAMTTTRRPQADRRQPAGGNLEPVHESCAPGHRAVRPAGRERQRRLGAFVRWRLERLRHGRAIGRSARTAAATRARRPRYLAARQIVRPALSGRGRCKHVDRRLTRSGQPATT